MYFFRLAGLVAALFAFACTDAPTTPEMGGRADGEGPVQYRVACR